MTTFCHIGMGRLGIAVANAMMLLQKGNTHAFFEPLPEARQKLQAGEYAEMEMVACATGNKVLYFQIIPRNCEVYIVTAGKPRTSPKQDKTDLLNENLAILEPLIERIPDGATVWIATNPPVELADFFGARPLRSCTDNLRKAVWGEDWKEANDRMLAAKGYTSYGPAVAIAKEVLLCLEPAR